MVVRASSPSQRETNIFHNTINRSGNPCGFFNFRHARTGSLVHSSFGSLQAQDTNPYLHDAEKTFKSKEIYFRIKGKRGESAFWWGRETSTNWLSQKNNQKEGLFLDLNPRLIWGQRLVTPYIRWAKCPCIAFIRRWIEQNLLVTINHGEVIQLIQGRNQGQTTFSNNSLTAKHRFHPSGIVSSNEAILMNKIGFDLYEEFDEDGTSCPENNSKIAFGRHWNFYYPDEKSNLCRNILRLLNGTYD